MPFATYKVATKYRHGGAILAETHYPWGRCARGGRGWRGRRYLFLHSRDPLAFLQQRPLAARPLPYYTRVHSHPCSWEPQDWGCAQDPNAADVGSPYIERHFAGSYEGLAMAVERYAHTRDASFLASVVVPLAAGVLNFTVQHYPAPGPELVMAYAKVRGRSVAQQRRGTATARVLSALPDSRPRPIHTPATPTRVRPARCRAPRRGATVPTRSQTWAAC